MSFWKNKKVLITGHTGFKGSWLTLWLQMLHAEVIGFSLPPITKPNLFSLANIKHNITSIMADIRDYEQVSQLIKTYQPEIILHLAAQPLVRYSYQEPLETYTTNVLGTLHILEAARQSGQTKVIVNVTTDKCYENKELTRGYHEEDRLGGYDPYSNSKACSELITSAYLSSYFNPNDYQKHNLALATVRAGNIIGGGDWSSDRLIPDAIRACMNQTPVQIRHPQSIRPWQYVLEPLYGYLLLAQRLYEEPNALYAGAWNFGPDVNEVKPVNWVVNEVINRWGKQASWVIDQKSHPHETQQLQLDCTKAKTKLQWRPKWSLQKSIKETVAWYQAYANNDTDMREFSLLQLKQYMDSQ